MLIHCQGASFSTFNLWLETIFMQADCQLRKIVSRFTIHFLNIPPPSPLFRHSQFGIPRCRVCHPWSSCRSCGPCLAPRSQAAWSHTRTARLPAPPRWCTLSHRCQSETANEYGTLMVMLSCCNSEKGSIVHLNKPDLCTAPILGWKGKIFIVGTVRHRLNSTAFIFRSKS